jgi:hypothetical protein
VEPHDVEFAVEGIDECANFRGRLRPGPQQPVHSRGANGGVGIPKSSPSQGGANRGEHPPNFLGEIAQRRDRPEADVPVGVRQQGQKARYRRQ